MRRGGGTLLLLAASLLAGAGGMALEAMLLAYLGLAAGQSVAGAYGIGAFVAGWAGGAFLAGRSTLGPRRGLVMVAVIVPFVALGAGAILRVLGSAGGAGALRTFVALLCVAACAVPQGLFLPLATRAWNQRASERKVAAIYAANLFGALFGAWAIGFELVSAAGRPIALACGVALSCLAALAAAAVAPRDAPEPARDTGVVSADTLSLWRAGAIVAAATLWSIGLEWLVLRLAVLWVGSQAFELTLVLAASMLALACGAALLPRLFPSNERGVLALLALAAIASVWPVFAAPALRAISERGDVATVLVLALPALIPLGAVVPLVHSAMAGEAGRRLGDLLAFEILGALAAGPLLHAWLVPAFGVGGAVAALCACGAVAAALSLRTPKARTTAVATIAICAAAGAFAARASEPALASPKLVDPALEVRAFREDEHFAVTVVDDGLQGERTLLTDQFRAAGTGRDYRYMRALGHLPLLLHRAPRRVAVVALGTGTTLGAVALHPEVERIEVLEISRSVVALAPAFEDVNGGVLTPGKADDRVLVAVEDGRRTLAEREGGFDVITIEPLLPDSPFGVYLYTPEFYAVVRRALAPEGLFCQWVPPHALEPRVFDAVLEAFARSFPWSSAWQFGTQVILLGGEAPPELAQRRFEGEPAELRRALEELGLSGPEALRARFVASLATWPASKRRLRDDDPWIAWRRKPAGAAVLSWLPTNLEALQRAASEPPWNEPRDEALERASTALRLARIAHARAEAEVLAAKLDPTAARAAVLAPLADIPRELRGDPELRAFVDEVEFLSALRSGVARLQAQDAGSALDQLLRAAELRPERADVHGYVALALQRAGQDRAASAALARALRGCPRFLETPAGRRLQSWGLKNG